jgi:hypothetical protein
MKGRSPEISRTSKDPEGPREELTQPKKIIILPALEMHKSAGSVRRKEATSVV